MDFVKIHKIEKHKMSDDAFYHEIARGIGMDTCRSSSSHTSRSDTKQAPQAKKPRHISRLDIPQAPKRTPVPSPSEKRAPRVLTRCLAFLWPAIPAGLSIAVYVLSWNHGDEGLITALLLAMLLVLPFTTRLFARMTNKEAFDLDCLLVNYLLPFAESYFGYDPDSVSLIQLLMPGLLAAELFAVSMLPSILSRYAAFDATDKRSAIIWSTLAAVFSVIMIVCAVVGIPEIVILFLAFFTLTVVRIADLLE